MRMLLPFLMFLVLASCASLSEDQCKAGDWYSIGLRDGAAGRLPDRIADHAEACAEYGLRPDAVLWVEGRTAGLRTYCSAPNAYEIGRRGERIAPVCPAEALREMRYPHAEGLRYHDLTREIEAAEREISHLETAILELGTDDRRLQRRLMRERSVLRDRVRYLTLVRMRYAYWS